MNEEELFIKFTKHSKFNDKINNECCNDILKDWIKSTLLLKAKIKSSCCESSLRLLEHFIAEASYEKDYIVKDNSIFGDLSQIRVNGFENRFLYNVKLFKTYIQAYKQTELEYEQNFGKRRYSSYDSFRQVRNRNLNK